MILSDVTCMVFICIYLTHRICKTFPKRPFTLPYSPIQECVEKHIFFSLRPNFFPTAKVRYFEGGQNKRFTNSSKCIMVVASCHFRKPVHAVNGKCMCVCVSGGSLNKKASTADAAFEEQGVAYGQRDKGGRKGRNRTATTRGTQRQERRRRRQRGKRVQHLS